MVAHNRRTLPDLRRVTAYIVPEEADWLYSLAASQGWTVSRMVAHLLWEAHEEERYQQHEMTEERLAMEGRL